MKKLTSTQSRSRVGRPPIKDEFTDKPLSRQRKWALRNPQKAKVINARYEKSEKGKQTRKLNRMRKNAQDKTGQS